jgi:competence protein ComEC
MLLSLGVSLFGRRHYIYIWFSLITIWLYALLTGMDPPIVRAVIMASIFLLAEFFGRQRSALTALTLAAAVMVGIEPHLLWQVSLQLSFLAMVGLVFISPPLRALGRKAVAWLLREGGAMSLVANSIVDAGAISLGAIIATWPLISYAFGLVSLVGLPATLLVMPALAGIIISSAVTGFLGLFLPTLAYIAGWVAWLFLSYMQVVVGVFTLLPLASLEVRLSSGLVLAYDLLLIIVWLAVRVGLRRLPAASGTGVQLQMDEGRKWVTKGLLPSLLVITILVWSAALSGPRERWQVSFLDVGQGQAILVQTLSQDILIDGGPSPQKLNLELSRQLPFWDRRIELVVLTQPHADHLAGLVSLLQRYEVAMVLETGVSYPSLLYAEWRSLLEEKGIRYIRAQAGQEIRLEKGVRMEVLNPPAELLKEKGGQVAIDDNGVVLRLSVGEVSFLLPADITEEGERELIFRRAQLRSDVLAVAHHGSQTSTSEEFLGVVRPQLAVISSAADNRYGHPSAETIARLKGRLSTDRIYLTQERGTIEMFTDGRRLWVRTAR